MKDIIGNLIVSSHFLFSSILLQAIQMSFLELNAFLKESNNIPCRENHVFMHSLNESGQQHFFLDSKAINI